MHRTVHGAALRRMVQGEPSWPVPCITGEPETPLRHARVFCCASDVMYYTYVLQSQKDGRFYTGFSEDLRQRIEAHTSGKVSATKHRLPVRLIFYEAYLNKYDALRREQYFKTSKGKSTLRAMLRETLAG